MEVDFGGAGEISFEHCGKLGLVTLTRPDALNALTKTMVHALMRALQAWESDDKIEAVAICGKGRAFCAGGDILDIYHAGKAGRPLTDFFAAEYRLNAYIKNYPKPYIALIDGIVMGGGVGVSIHGSHRLFTQNASFAMPEVGIGFFPDVGGSFFLPRLRGRSGYWLGLTGTRIGRDDSLHLGLASHAICAEDLDVIIDELATRGARNDQLSKTLDQYGVDVSENIDFDKWQCIDEYFAEGDLDAIIERLCEATCDQTSAQYETAYKALSALTQKSPTSLHIAYQQLSTGADLSIRECMAMEFRIVNRMLIGHDFYEGIRTALIDKGDKAMWQPENLNDVRKEDIANYFASLEAKELQL